MVRASLMASVAAIAFAAGASTAHAQDQPGAASGSAGAEVGQIVVTARRKEELLQDIPLAIDAFTEDTIERQNLVRVEDLTKLNAGLTFDIGGFPNDTRPALRGMQAERGRPSVAVLLDGHDLSGENLSIAGGSSSLRMDLFDLERIEIVRGPQATLYGRNAFAGAINYISKKPEFYWGAKATAEAAEGGLIRGSASVTGPLIEDVLAFRINGAIKEFDGYYRNPVNGGELGAENTKGIAGSLLLTPAPGLSILGRYQYSESDMSDLPTAFIFSNERLPVPGGTFTAGPPGTPPTACPASLTGLPGSVVRSCTRGTFVGAISADESDVQMSFNPLTGEPPFGMRLDSNLGSVKVEYETDNLGTFTYAFGWMKDHSRIEQDGDFTSTPAPPGLVLSVSALQDLEYDTEHTDHTLFWNYGNAWFDVVLGAQFFQEDSRLNNAGQFWLRNPSSPLAGFPFFLRTAPLPATPFPVVNTRDTNYTGIFGGVTVEPVANLILGAEVRYNEDEITYTTNGHRLQDTSLIGLTPQCLPGFELGSSYQGGPPVGQPPPGVVVACPQEATIKDKIWTPRFSAQYEWTPDVMTYVSYAEGFKPGGFNTNEIVSLENQNYAPETVKTYEVGFKSTLLNNRARFNIAAYRNDYRDQQIGVQMTSTGAAGQQITSPGIVNAGIVRTQGIETDIMVEVTDILTLAADYAYTDSKFRNFVQGPPPGAATADFAACGVPEGQTSSTQNRAEAGNICGDFSGNRVGKNPKHALNLRGLIEFTPAARALDNVFIEAIASYRSERFVDEANLATLPSYWVAGLKAGFEADPFSLTLYVDNIFNDTKIKSAQRLVDFGNPEGFAPGRGYIAYLPQPRTMGVRVSAEF